MSYANISTAIWNEPAMSKDINILVVGSLNADVSVQTRRLPQGGETVSGWGLITTPGGKGANQAVAAAKLGASVALAGAVGNDPHGDLLVTSVKSAGVETTYVDRLPNIETGVALITTDANAENNIVIVAGANGSMDVTRAQLAVEAFNSAKVLCLSLEIPIEAVKAAAEAARRAGVMVILNLSPYTSDAAELATLADVVVVNEHEAAQLVGQALEDVDLVEALSSLGVTTAIVTRGAHGLSIIEDATVRHLQAVPIKAVDTTGSGDAFTGALVAALADNKDLMSAAAFGASAGAYAATGRGAQPSYGSRRDLERVSQ